MKYIETYLLKLKEDKIEIMNLSLNIDCSFEICYTCYTAWFSSMQLNTSSGNISERCLCSRNCFEWKYQSQMIKYQTDI